MTFSLLFLTLERSEFAGVDVTAARLQYKATTAGIVPESRGRIGISIEVVSREPVQEIKRAGLVFDRHLPLQLRLGDYFVLYISRGG